MGSWTPLQRQKEMPILTKIVGISTGNKKGGKYQDPGTQLRPGDELVLRREPGIQAENNVIQVLSKSGQMIGYLNADLATSEAFSSDSDLPNHVFVTNTSGRSAEGCKIMIVMPDDDFNEAMQELENIKKQRDSPYNRCCCCLLIAIAGVMVFFLWILLLVSGVFARTKSIL
jgi:hypothetical protein